MPPMQQLDYAEASQENPAPPLTQQPAAHTIPPPVGQLPRRATGSKLTWKSGGCIIFVREME